MACIRDCEGARSIFGTVDCGEHELGLDDAAEGVVYRLNNVHGCGLLAG